MNVVNMNQLSKAQILQAAQILTDCFPLPSGYPSLEAAQKEVEERLIPENTLLAVVEDDVVIGWGGILAPIYCGNVFELHPLVVRADRRKMGVGRSIVTALEAEAKKRGGLTIQLGADDENDETSLANADLYDNLAEKLKFFNPGVHQAGFYMKLGYKIIGVMPDANGIGKPDIFLAKKL